MSGNNNIGAAAIRGSAPPAKSEEQQRRKPPKRKKIHPLFSRGIMDLSFFLIIMTLLVIGIVMMFSASYAWALNESGGESGTGYAMRQTMWAALGLVAMLFFSYFDYHHFSRPKLSIGLYAVCLIMLLLVFTPLGITHNGATRWLNLGFEFQPSELMKFAVIILFSYLIVQNYERMNKFFVGIVPFALLLGIIILILMKQPHLSCTILICLTGITLMFVGGVRWSHIIIIGVLGVAVLAVIVYKKSMGAEGYTYFFNRFRSWLDPFSDVTDTTYQTCQSLIAIGSGGPFGLGLGESRQKFMYLPETQNDFVFAIVCEELGFVGAVTIILLFALLVIRGLLIASKANDKFGMLLTIGITMQIGIQAFLNIAVVSNLIPNTGISLPFFSYGGTALVMQLAEVGVILNVSRQSAAMEG
ncbi:MAG: putative lipid II flippase FtsW [Clostridium sp.]|nr:putative lipid II flippase FtsW [Clostridium sp.]MCM1546909.1 putative lipid II flippase FtsW [Ruminococcus sp.]